MFDLFFLPFPYRYEQTCTISYVLALIVNYALLLGTNKAQPALQFIVPFLLIGIFATAGCRKEVSAVVVMDSFGGRWW